MGVRSARNKRGRKPGRERKTDRWAWRKQRPWPQEYKDLIDLLSMGHGHTRSRRRTILRLEREKRAFIHNAMAEGYEPHRGLNFFYSTIKDRLDKIRDAFSGDPDKRRRWLLQQISTDPEVRAGLKEPEYNTIFDDDATARDRSG